MLAWCEGENVRLRIVQSFGSLMLNELLSTAGREKSGADGEAVTVGLVDAQLSAVDVGAGRGGTPHARARAGGQGVLPPGPARRPSQPRRPGAGADDAQAVGDLHGQAHGGGR